MNFGKSASLLVTPFLVGLLTLLPAAPAHAMDLIRVQGKAEKKFAPDVAYLNASVWSKAKSAKKAEEMNAGEFSRIEKLLTQTYKVDKKLIQTIGLNLNPEYQYNQNSKPTILGYTSNHQIRVSIHDLDVLGKLIDSLLSGKNVDENVGVNIEGIQFGTEKSNAYELEVLTEAMKDARARADVIAKAAGRSVKSIHLVTHGTPNVILPFRNEIMAASADARMMKAGAPTTSVQPGEINISTEVTVEYEF